MLVEHGANLPIGGVLGLLKHSQRLHGSARVQVRTRRPPDSELSREPLLFRPQSIGNVVALQGKESPLLQEGVAEALADQGRVVIAQPKTVKVQNSHLCGPSWQNPKKTREKCNQVRFEIVFQDTAHLKKLFNGTLELNLIHKMTQIVQPR